MKFKIKHFKNLLIRVFTLDKYYVCEECHKIHKRDGKEIRLEEVPGKLLSHRLWYGSVSRECYTKLNNRIRTQLADSFTEDTFWEMN